MARTVDFAALYQQLVQAEHALSPESLSAERVQQILLERSRALAATDARDARAERPRRSTLVFGLAGGQYAVDSIHADEVLPLDSLTPVPGAAPVIAGVTSRRGEILLVVDLVKILGLTRRGLADMTKLVVVGPRGAEVGLLAESIEGIREIDADQIHPAVGETPYVEAVADGDLVLLDVPALLSDPRLSFADAPRSPLT